MFIKVYGLNSDGSYRTIEADADFFTGIFDLYSLKQLKNIDYLNYENLPNREILTIYRKVGNPLVYSSVYGSWGNPTRLI